MEQRDPRQIQAALIKPFAPEDLEWRLQQAFEDKMRGIAVPYVTNRAIQNRLDEAVGPENWYNDYKPWHGAGKKESQLCGIAIYYEGRGFITKWDGAEDSDIEPVKGGLSDSMKRAAVQWGIGRVLYSLNDTVWVSIEKKGKSYIIPDSERAKLDKVYLNLLSRLGLTPAPPCGTQAQLTPRAAKESSQTGAPPAQAANQERQTAPAAQAAQTRAAQPPVEPPAPPAGQSGKVMDIPRPERPAYEYIVESASIQNGMSSQSTSVVLKDAGGKAVKAFARGIHEALTRGTPLVNVKLSVKKQGTVVFNYLEGYELADGSQRAA